MLLWNTFYIFVLCYYSTLAVQLPPEIPKCSRSDPAFSECMVTSMTKAFDIFKDGYKDFGFPSVNPFKIPKLEIAADPGKSVKINQKYENVEMTGMTNSEVTQFSLDDDGKTCLWKLEVVVPWTKMHADYQMTGQILLFPINGYGKCNVTLEGIRNEHTADCEHYMKKGKSHLRLKNYKMNMNVKNVDFQFPNLLPGNEQISRELQKTVNENSLEIFQDVKGGFEELLSKLHENSANSVFSKIPEDELFLP